MKAQVFAVLAFSACSAPEVVCSTLTDALQQCGFPVDELNCNNVSRAELEQLAEHFGARDCAAFSTGARAVDPRVCALGGWTCPDSPTPAPSGKLPKFPVILVSGIDGTPIFDWNPEIVTALTAAGLEAHHVAVLPWGTTRERAEDLQLSLQSLMGHLRATKVNLVCYAVGGLDCRYLASPGGLNAGGTIASITTIATPHRGTRVAEAALSALQNGSVNDVLQALAGSDTHLDVPQSAKLLATLDGLGLDALDAFNRAITDAPGVSYFSYAGISSLSGKTSASIEHDLRQHCAAPDGTFLFQRHPGTRDVLNPILWATVPFSFDIHGDGGRLVSSPSDGMISVASAKWGEFLGCLPADHYDVVGEIGHHTRDAVTGFDAQAFYLYLASELAGRGL